MEKQEYQRMFDLEERYWWFRGKRFLIGEWFSKYYTGKKPKVLDVGCGSGMTMKSFGFVADMHGVDVSSEAVGFCKKRGLDHVKKGSAMKLPYKNGEFDAVFVLDVLYHKMVDEDKALSEIFRVLKKGGRVFVTDSAMMLLWSKHDVAAHAGKRFDKVTLWGPMEDAGFKIEKMSYFNTLLFIPVFLARKLGNQPGEVSTDITELPTILNEFLYYLYITELWFLKWISYPFGVSIFAVGRK
jgi:ubiquinone/menaquinone biosynthesis C-methylase UbiE|tara:strand:- start:112 stop:834 length:723 start_codon:yes stop_codon:yes gene_type:complete